MRARSIALALLLAAALPAAGADADKGAAVGVFLGQPTGLTARLGLSGPGSIEAKAAWDFAGAKDGSAAFLFQANWLLEFPGVLELGGEDVPPYVGAGVELDVGPEFLVGIRIPAGLAYRLKRAPLELCVEVGLGMGLFPSTKVLASGGIGVRYVIGSKAR